MTSQIGTNDAPGAALGPGRRLGLVGDIGGTNARFGLVDLDRPGEGVQKAQTFLCADFEEAMDAIRVYLRQHGIKRPTGPAVIAVAGPVTDGAIRFTNSPWRLSESELLEAGFASARLINDYAALALAAPLLVGEDVRVIGPDLPVSQHQTLAVLGPGTGFGVAAVARDGAGEAALSTEGGHVAFAPTDDTEIQILRWFSKRYARVSVERLLSGPGLRDLYAALGEIHGMAAPLSEPADITRGALAGEALPAMTVRRFCAILGSVAGDFALAYGARGGVFIAGGIPPLIIDLLAASNFRERFEDKGRFEPYLAAIPTRVILRPHAALIGAARGLSDLLSRG